MTPLNTTVNPVDTTTVRYLIRNLEGELHVPKDPDHRAFFVAVIQRIQDFLREHGPDALIASPRSHAPAFGAGSAVEDMDPQDMAETVAASHAHTFNGELVACSGPADTSLTPHQLAVRELLVSIEHDAWSVVAYGLEERELLIPEAGYLAGVLTPVRD